jgi:hypothetical protein
VHVLLYPDDDDFEFGLRGRGPDLHGHVGSFDTEPPEDDSRRLIGFRLPERAVSGFPRGPSISTDGKTWTACDLRDTRS